MFMSRYHMAGLPEDADLFKERKDDLGDRFFNPF